jgi:hypothetical protein
MYKDCPFKPQGGHVPQNDIMDKFADAVCDKLGKGFMYVKSKEKTATWEATYLTVDQE